jgi:hypothetical protein
MTRVSCVQRCCAVCARGFDTDEGVEDFKAVLARKVDALPGRIEECTAASESARAARDAVRALGAFLFIHSRAGDAIVHRLTALLVHRPRRRPPRDAGELRAPRTRSRSGRRGNRACRRDGRVDHRQRGTRFSIYIPFSRRIYSYPIFLIHRLTRLVRMHPHSGTRRRGGEARANHRVDGRRRRDIRARRGDGLGESFTRGPGAVHGRCVFHPERPNSLPPVPNYIPITDQLPTNYLLNDPFRIVHTQSRRRRSVRRAASSRSGASFER